MTDVRQKAKEFLDQLPPKTDVTSNGNTAALFTTLTGMTHQQLQAIWKEEDKAKAKARAEGKTTKGLPTTTTCNAFVGKLSHHIRSPIYLGRFDIENKLKAEGLGEAWVPTSSGKRPGYGDVFRMKRFHVGVSLDFTGDLWNTAEAGQGGPGVDYTTGYDVARRKQQPWDPSTLQGWVDIAVLMKISQKAPQWMIGWWAFELTKPKTKEFVYIPERGSARAFPTAPTNFKLPPPAGGKAGDMTMDEDSQGVSIAWQDNVTDILRRVPNVPYMLGNRGGPQLQAFKQQ